MTTRITHDADTVPVMYGGLGNAVQTPTATRPVILYVPTLGVFRPCDSGQPTLRDLSRYLQNTQSPIYVCDGLGTVYGVLDRGGWSPAHTIHPDVHRQCAVAVADASVNGVTIPDFPVTFPAEGA